jgi:autotransporter-associated beta strand protein
LVFAGSTSGTAVVTIDGSHSAPGGLQFGDSSAASSYAITAETGGILTLGTAGGASIAVVSGTQAIAAPIVLEGNLAVNASAGTRLNLSGGIVQDAGVTAAIDLSGGGLLVLSGTNSFSGGVTVTGGTLDLLDPYDLPDGSSLTVGDATTFAGGAPTAVVAPQDVTAVPEPGCLAMVAVAGIGVFALRRRFRLASPRRFA